METFEKVIIALTNAMEKLTLKKIVLLFVFGLVMSLLMYTYEHRDKMFDKLLADQNMSLIFTGAIILLILGWIFAVLISKVIEDNEEYNKSLEQRLDEAIKREVVSDAAYKALLEKAVMFNGPKRRSYDEEVKNEIAKK